MIKLNLKCSNCNKPLTSSNSVFIKITRYDMFGRRLKRKVFCTTCWDHTKIIDFQWEDAR